MRSKAKKLPGLECKGKAVETSVLFGGVTVLQGCRQLVS